MKNHTVSKLAVSALAGTALLSVSAYGGGLSLYEIATPDVGLASAGYASRAQDASTVFKNPAGMSYLDGAQLQVGGQLTYGSVQFTPDANTSPYLQSEGGGNAIGALPAAGLFLSIPLSEKFAVGFASVSYFGLLAKYDDNWVGRYYIQEGDLVGVSLLPSASFKATDWLSIGAGLNAMYGYLKNEVAINRLRPQIPDGQMTLKDETWGFGANVGVMVEPQAGTRIGVTYLSPVNLDFKANPTFSVSGFQSPQLDLGMKVPQSVMVSVYRDLNKTWALMADFGWQNWSQFGEVNVGIEAGNSPVKTVNANYQDTWHGALGAQYKASDKWTFTGGAAYDSSAVDSAHRSVVAPMGQAWRFGVGAIYQASQKVSLGAGYEYLWGGDMSINQGTPGSLRGHVSGSYNDSWFSFASLNLNWKF